MHTSRRVLPTLALAGSAALALAGLALVITRALSGAAASVSPPVAPAPPAVVSAREVCSLSNSDAAAAQIQGADGGVSVTVGDRTYWLFGDTLFLAASGKQIEANAIAWSSAQPTDGCPKLTYLTRDGLGVPFIEKDGSLTVWPAGAYAVDDHTFDVYVVYVYGSGPYAYWIGEVGLARVDTSTMQTTVLARSLWSAATMPRIR